MPVPRFVHTGAESTFSSLFSCNDAAAALEPLLASLYCHTVMWSAVVYVVLSIKVIGFVQIHDVH